MKKKILVSACLLGTPCRYDGKSKSCEQILALKERYELVPICPEVLGGLTTPRLPCELKGGKIIRSDGVDMSENYKKGADLALAIARENGCDTAILKEKSPSCSPHMHYDGTFSKKLTDGPGITAELFLKNRIRVLGEDEVDLL